jgi:hypothetical protein
MQNAFSPFPRVSKVLIVPSWSLVQIQVFSEVQGKLLAVRPYKIKNYMLPLQWHRVNVPNSKGRNRKIVRKDPTKARLKSIMAIIKSSI